MLIHRYNPFLMREIQPWPLPGQPCIVSALRGSTWAHDCPTDLCSMEDFKTSSNQTLAIKQEAGDAVCVSHGITNSELSLEPSDGT